MEKLVCVLSVKMFTLWLSVLLFSVHIPSSDASYNFTIRFFEFRNPLGLQCAECGSGGPPACCDDVQRFENCNMARPFTCDTRFRFLLRPFGEPVETAPNTGYPYFTPGSGDNSEVFSEANNGLLALPNPFTITRNEAWTGKIQFFVDAVDRPVNMATSGISETLAIINRFPIDLELNPGPNFTERTTYTGIYNISDLGFDMSFRVQCLENYYGPNCTTFCESMEGVNTCDSEGRPVCLQDNRDPDTNCKTCLQGWDSETNQSTCSPFFDGQSNCTQCVSGRDINSCCTTCLAGYDPSSNCTECLPGIQCKAIQQPSITTDMFKTTSAAQVDGSGINLALVGGAVGGAAGLLFLFLLVLCTIIVVLMLQLKRHRKMTFPGAVDNPPFSRDMSVKEKTETAKLGEHDFENPLYDEAKQESSSLTDMSDYSKLQRPPLQKSFAPPKFPYTMDHKEEASYQLDVAGKAGVTSNGHPGYDIAYPPPLIENSNPYDVTCQPNSQPPQPSPSTLAGGIYNLANYPEEEQVVYDVADQPLPEGPVRLSQNDYADIVDMPSSVPRHSYDYADIADAPGQSSAPHYDYADAVVPLSSHNNITHPPPPAVPMNHEYAETKDVMLSCPSESVPIVAYTNTTPGQVTPEALNHYEFAQ